MNRLSLSCLLLLIIFTLSILSCGSKKQRNATRGFYYWKTALRLTPYEKDRLLSLHSNKLYLRCFDVEMSGIDKAPHPVGTIRMPTQLDTAFTYVPVVFITKQVLTECSTAQLPLLAENINRLLTSLTTTNSIRSTEVQIDCDWTGNTRGSYFELLRQLRTQPYFRDKLLSCTIRLHQVKYTVRSGIPPVDRGLLMCYNIGNLRQPGPHNSIFQESVAKEYLGNVGSYRLPLDIAFPVFEWCVQFRHGQFHGILRDVSPGQVQTSGIFSRKGKNLYTSDLDTAWLGYSFLKGDEVRLETPDPQQVQAIADYLAVRRKDTALSVVLFHADSTILSKHSHNELEAIYSAFD